MLSSAHQGTTPVTGPAGHPPDTVASLPGPRRPEAGGDEAHSTCRCKAKPVRISVEFAADTTFVSVGGEIDILTEPLLSAALTPLLVGDADTLILDLQDVCYIDARGIGTLAEAARFAAAHGTCLRVVPSRIVRRVADLTDLAGELWPPPRPRRPADDAQ